jgi:hypothetical protein
MEAKPTLNNAIALIRYCPKAIQIFLESKG